VERVKSTELNSFMDPTEEYLLVAQGHNSPAHLTWLHPSVAAFHNFLYVTAYVNIIHYLNNCMEQSLSWQADNRSVS